MRNKGRRQKHLFGVQGKDGMAGAWNSKGTVIHLTRPIMSMSSNGYALGTFDKRKWSKRVRGYSKSQTKDIYLLLY